MMLSRRFPEKEPYLDRVHGISGHDGYFRVASDKHYMSDVLVGALTGITIGKMIQIKDLMNTYHMAYLLDQRAFNFIFLLI